MSYLFNAVTEDDFLKILVKKDLQGEHPCGIMLGREVLDSSLAQEYKRQARSILSLPLWKLVSDSAVWTANEKIFKEAKNSDDLMYPRAMIYTLDIINKKLQNIAKIDN